MGSLAGAHRSSFFVRASPDTGTVLAVHPDSEVPPVELTNEIMKAFAP
jgi:hypothetical protein